jgi:methyl-accepting chemotaxis protein
MLTTLLRRFDIRTRMPGAIAMVIGLLAMLGGLSWWSLRRIGEAVTHRPRAQPVEARQLVDMMAQIERLFGAGSVVATVLVVPLTLVNMVSICEPSQRARILAERIATGDLTTQPGDEGNDETARSLCSLQAM